MSRLSSIIAIVALAACHHDRHFDRTDLVSDQPGVAAITDPGLVNAWGIAVDGGDTVFIGANGTGQVSVYDGATFHVPAGFPLQTTDAAPITGIAINNTGGFVITGDLGTAPADLLMVSEDGKLYAWSASATSVPMVILDDSATNASFKGLAIVDNGTPQLVINDFVNQRVVQIDSSLKPAAPLPTAFVDPKLPANYGPFGIQQLGTLVYMTFAQLGGGIDEADGAGLGVVDAFALDGTFVRRISNGLELDAPWGLALSPSDFGDFPNALLVGNFGDGAIHAFDPVLGDLLGTVEDRDDNPIIIDGLWGITFGNGPDSNTLLFAAGPNGEANGLVGKITDRD